MVSWQNLALPSPFHVVQSVGAPFAGFSYVSSHVPMIFLSFAVLVSFAEAWASTAAHQHCHQPSEYQQYQARNGEVGSFLDKEYEWRVPSVPRARTTMFEQRRLRFPSQCVLRILAMVVSKHEYRVLVAGVFVNLHVVHPGVGQEHESGCHHRLEPWGRPVAGMLLNSFVGDEMTEERMLRPGEDEGVVDTDWPL